MLPICWFFAQAEPAPAPAAPPEPTPARSVPDPSWQIDESAASTVGFAAGVGWRLGAPGREVPPAAGLSLTTLLGHRYAVVAGWLGLGALASLGYDRYSRTVRRGSALEPATTTGTDGVRGLSVFDFGALQTLSWERGRVRPFLAGGGGLCLSYFNSPEPRFSPGESRVASAVLLGGAGVDVNLQQTLDLSVRLEYAHLIAPPTFQTDSGERLRLFANRLAARLGVRYRF